MLDGWEYLDGCARKGLDVVDQTIASGGGCLVHCGAGSSRSGATVVAYLVHRAKRPVGECLVWAQRARSIIAPNPGFQAQLLSWERSCLGAVSLRACAATGPHMHEHGHMPICITLFQT